MHTDTAPRLTGRLIPSDVANLAARADAEATKAALEAAGRNAALAALEDQARRLYASLRRQVTCPHPSYRVPKSAVESDRAFLRGVLWAIVTIGTAGSVTEAAAQLGLDMSLGADYTQRVTR